MPSTSRLMARVVKSKSACQKTIIEDTRFKAPALVVKLIAISKHSELKCTLHWWLEPPLQAPPNNLCRRLKLERKITLDLSTRAGYMLCCGWQPKDVLICGFSLEYMGNVVFYPVTSTCANSVDTAVARFRLSSAAKQRILRARVN